MTSLEGSPNTCFRVFCYGVHVHGTMSMGKNKKTRVEVDSLIIEVQKRPSLYDTEHPSYRDAEKTGNLWMAIGTVLEASGKVL